jgi:hypothetical protein
LAGKEQQIVVALFLDKHDPTIIKPRNETPP